MELLVEHGLLSQHLSAGLKNESINKINITFLIVDVHSTIGRKLTQSALLWRFVCRRFNLDHQLSWGAFHKYRFLGLVPMGSGFTD